MASNQPGAVQNKLGELFVNLGIGGLPNLLKGLNMASAQFLLTKASAEQFIKPLVNMSKSAGQYVTSLDKINAVTGLTRLQLQDLEKWSKLNDVSFSDFVSQLGNLQQNLLKIRLGQGDISGFQLIGLDPTTLDYRDPLKALDQIKQKILQLDEPTQRLAIQQLGLSDSLLYAWKQENTLFNERLKLTAKEMDSAREQQKLWNSLSVTWESAQNKFIANQEWINTVLRTSISLIGDLTDKAIEFSKSDKLREFMQRVPDLFFPLGPLGKDIYENIKDIKENGWNNSAYGANFYYPKKEFVENILPSIILPAPLNIGRQLFNTAIKARKEAQSDLLPIDNAGLSSSLEPPPLSQNLNNLSSNNSNYQLQVNNYITGDNPEQIAQATSQSLENSVIDLSSQPAV